jgi:hypothetical protein
MCRGVDKFLKTLAKLASNSVFLLAKSDSNWAQNIESVRAERNRARLASGFVFLFANPEFYSHLVSWRVDIRTPDYVHGKCSVKEYH